MTGPAPLPPDSIPSILAGIAWLVLLAVCSGVGTHLVELGSRQVSDWLARLARALQHWLILPRVPSPRVEQLRRWLERRWHLDLRRAEGRGGGTVLAMAVLDRARRRIEERTADRSIAVGWYIRAAGLFTVVLAFLIRERIAPVAAPLALLGGCALVVGGYMAARRELLRRHGHRIVLSAGLLVVPFAAFWLTNRLSTQVQPNLAVLVVFVAAGTFAAIAATIGYLAVTGCFGRDAEPLDPAPLIVLWATRALATASLLYSVGYVMLAATIGPSLGVEGTTLLTATLLSLAARECLYTPIMFSRLLGWVRLS